MEAQAAMGSGSPGRARPEPPAGVRGAADGRWGRASGAGAPAAGGGAGGRRASLRDAVVGHLVLPTGGGSCLVEPL